MIKSITWTNHDEKNEIMKSLSDSTLEIRNELSLRLRLRLWRRVNSFIFILLDSCRYYCWQSIWKVYLHMMAAWTPAHRIIRLIWLFCEFSKVHEKEWRGVEWSGRRIKSQRITQKSNRKKQRKSQKVKIHIDISFANSRRSHIAKLFSNPS